MEEKRGISSLHFWDISGVDTRQNKKRQINLDTTLIYSTLIWTLLRWPKHVFKHVWEGGGLHYQFEEEGFHP